MPLVEYRRKRHFDKTAEPAGKAAKSRRAGKLSYVIQKHAATRLHYDFRLELDGALKSWAVPKGPSYDPSEKRLAVEVEDHPMEYAGFEGTIPAGEYGGGEVIVWDRGTYETVPPGEAEAMREKGHLHLRLFGEKLRGEWHLIRTAGQEESEARPWLFFKAKDKLAAATR